MAKRRRGSANGKGREFKIKGRSLSTETDDKEGEGKDSGNENVDGSSAPVDPGDPEKDLVISNTESNPGNETSPENLMPLDIQQMILGDLQAVGGGDEIIVSREPAGDSIEDEIEVIVESPREVEYEVHTDEEEEEELVFMNDEEGEDGHQYVIVVNSDYEVANHDDTSQEIMSIQNLELQGNSCGIITVVRESDYESSQESVDGNEEECDNINTVIGTIDGIHCVKISQYSSDDESVHEDDVEMNEIRVTETEIECFSTIENDGNQQLLENCEHLSVEFPEDDKLPLISEEFNETQEHNCTEQVDDLPKVVLIQKQLDKDDNSDSGMAAVDLVSEPKSEVQLENNYELGTENMETTDVKTETVLNVKESDNETVCEKDSKTSVTQADSDKLNNKTISTSEETPDVASNPELLNIEKTLGENCLPDSSESKDITRTLRTRTKPVNIEHTNLYLESEECKKEIVSSIINSEHQNLQEHIVSSNSSVSEVVSSHITDASSQSPKKENITSNSLQNFFSIDKDCKVEIKEVLAKGESSHCKEESEKQATFRSRSGSTDTTGSDSGSNSGSGRRRSGRIKSISTLKQSELDNSRSAAASTAVTSTTTPPVPGYEADKPVKVKSRWRRSSELEMGSSNRRQLELDVINANLRLQIDSDNTMTPPPRCGQPSTPPDTPPPDKEVEDILAKFEHLDSNEYLTDRSKSKDAKRMVCDCTLSKEELARGDMGCGEDCLNRLLMIECGARCMLGERCANKRFQNLEYAKCEVFKTDFKGYGLRAMEDIPVDTFLLEYVGEVLDPKEFRKRAKDYAKDKTPHFYFMALKSDSLIDATLKGNVSRFINHSCDPNAETQKWTVNGELRVGFFSKRHITMGEEITFDYKFQRYGKEAQKCYCQAALCRGWIGEDPEKENKWSDISGRNRERKEKERKKKEDKRNIKDTLNDIDLEEEIEKLVLKNRAQTLMLCRLMVRAEDHSSRLQLLRILQNGETACLRLFLDYHGLRLVWSWMMDPASSSSLKIEILETLSKLPIPNKTMLQDSKVLGVVEKWSTTSLLVGEAKDRSSTEDEIDKGTDVDKDKLTKGSDSDKNSDESNTGRTTENEEQQEANKKRIVELANGLLQEWASLKEVFRIPKKERIEQMKEHEREADKVSRDSSVEKQDKSYDRHWTRNDYDRRDRDRKRGRDSPDSDKSRKSAKVDDKQLQLSKLERRQQFAIRAAQEEEQRLRRQQESMWQEQVQIAAHELAAQQAQEFSKYQWMPFPHPEANMMPPQHMEGQAMFGTVNHNNPPPPFLFSQNNPHMHQHPPFLDPSHNPPQFHNPVNPMFNHPPPLPKQPLLPTPPLPNQPHLPSPNQQLVPNPNQHLLHNPNQPLLPNTNQPLLPNPNQHLLPNPNQPLLPNPNQRLMSNPNQPLLHNPNQVPMPNPNQPFLHNPNQPPMPNLNQPLLHNPNQPPLPNPNQSLLPIHPPLPNQPLLPTPHQSMLHTPPLPNQPYMATQQVQPLMSKPPPLPNQPHPTNLPAFTTQPPLPSQPSPIVMTSQPQPAAPLGYPQDVSVSQHFQTTPQSQFTKPPPFTTQPPLPSLPPAPSPQNTIYQTAPVVAATQVTSAVAPLPLYLPVRLPRWWKNARNAEGHTYYYNVKTKVTQWEPPVWELQQEQVVQEFESESESSESDDDDSSSDDEEQEEEKQVEEDEPESVVEMTDNNEDLGCDELGDSPYEPETMELLEDIVGDTKKKGKDILVQERIISPRTADEIPDKLDKKKIRELKERLRRQKAKEKQRLKQKSKLKGRSATSKCEADTSSDPGRKIKDAFRLNMAGVIVHYLNAYRKPDCKFGKITNTEDFKHLARKLTHFVMVKELKHCRSVDELECNDNVKHKARDFIKKYMAKFGPMYHRPDDD